MEDGYWDLFWQTGAPEFYLLKKQEEDDDAGKKREEQHTGDVVQPVYG